ncbi:MAG: hypothetical protein ACP5QR_16870 [Rhizomicrobium sp.]
MAQLQCARQFDATQRYEILRAAALGTALPPEARSGLTILLHRGMWAWVRTILRTPSQCPPAVVTTVGLPMADGTSRQRAFIDLLATMVMAVPERRKTA